MIRKTDGRVICVAYKYVSVSWGVWLNSFLGLVLRKETKAAMILYTELQYIWYRHPSIVIGTNWEIIMRGRPISLFRGPATILIIRNQQDWKPIVGTDSFAVIIKLFVYII